MPRVTITELMGSALSIQVKVKGKLQRYLGVAPYASASFFVDPSEEADLQAELCAAATTGLCTYDFNYANPTLDWLDGGAVAVAGGDAVLKGTNLLQGQTFDALVFGTGTAQLILTMLKPGFSGYSAKVVQGSGVLSTVIAGKLLTITLAAAGSISDQVATEVNKALPNTCKGIVRATGGGAGAMVIAALASFAGGVGPYVDNVVKVAGVEALPLHATGTTPVATWADGEITVTVPALTGKSAGDILNIAVETGGQMTGTLSFVGV